MSSMTLSCYVSDHRLNGRPLLPGVLSVEMLLAGATHALGTPVDRLCHVAFHRPAWADDHGSLRTQLRCRQQSQGLHCQLYTAANTDPAEWLEHASASAEVGPVAAAGALDLAALRRRCSHVVAPEDLYHRLAAYGLGYGPSLRALVRVAHNGTEVFVDLRVPSTGDDEATNCRLHPALLDGSLQALACLTLQDDGAGPGLFLPFAAEEVRVHAPLQGRAFAHGRLRRGSEVDRYTAEVTLTDERGRVLVELRGLRARRVPVSVTAPSRNGTMPSRPAARILRPLWRPAAVAPFSSASQTEVRSARTSSALTEAVS